MSLTKQDIDALVGKVDTTDLCDDTGAFLDDQEMANSLRAALYKAAGLTAEGERKPERVRCWMITSDGDAPWFTHIPPDQVRLRADPRVTPGWFVPSEEGET